MENEEKWNFVASFIGVLKDIIFSLDRLLVEQFRPLVCAV